LNPESGLKKVEKLIYPASAVVTFFGEDIKMLAAGDWDGMISTEIGYLKAWHPPTLKGVMNAVTKGALGSGAVVTLAGWGLEQAGRIVGSGTVSELGGVVYDGGKGVMVAGLADMIVRPTKYNPHFEAAGTSPAGDPVMRSMGYYERGGEQVKPSMAFR